MIVLPVQIVPILYRGLAFEAFDDFSDFLESISCETLKSCQDRGSNPCRGATPFTSIAYKRIQTSAYEFCTWAAKCNVLIHWE
jgi:hypothetical protein